MATTRSIIKVFGHQLLRNVIETLGSGWSVELVAVEVGACGLQSTSLSAGFNSLQRLGLLAGYDRNGLNQLCSRLSFLALRCSYAIWTRQDDRLAGGRAARQLNSTFLSQTYDYLVTWLFAS